MGDAAYPILSAGKLPTRFEMLNTFYSLNSTSSQMPPSPGLGDPILLRTKITCLLPLVPQEPAETLDPNELVVK